MSSYKIVQLKATADGALTDAMQEFEELRDELTEWRDNLESGGLDQTPKYEEVSEAAGALENADLAVEWPAGNDIAPIGDREIEFRVSVNRRKARGPSRAVRCGNAVARLEAVIELLEGVRGEWEKRETRPDDFDSLTELIDMIENVKMEVEAVEFPGMF